MKPAKIFPMIVVLGVSACTVHHHHYPDSSPEDVLAAPDEAWSGEDQSARPEVAPTAELEPHIEESEFAHDLDAEDLKSSEREVEPTLRDQTSQELSSRIAFWKIMSRVG